MALGTVVKILKDKGFGFIQIDGDAVGVWTFFHRSSFVDRAAFDVLVIGQRVSCVVESADKGQRASHVIKES